MSIRSNGMTCLSFDKNEITFLTFDPATQKSLDHRTVTCDFEVTDDSGKITNPTTLGAYLQEYFETQNLPQKCRVALSLKFLDLKQLSFPTTIPDEELRDIIRDEAIRESIFSYSGDPIAVAYKIGGVKKMDTGFTNKEVLVATTPENVIESIKMTFENTGLKLLSVQPNLEGLELFIKKKVTSDAPVILVNLADNHAEFYIWSDGQPKFWRYLSVGADEPERLANEVTLSLEHYQRRAGNVVNLSLQRVIVIGKSIPLALGSALQVEYLSGEPLADLYGLALVNSDEVRFYFMNSQEKSGPGQFSRYLVQAWPVGLIFLIGLGLWSGHEIYAQRQQMEILRQQQTELTNTRSSLEKQLDNLQRLSVSTGKVTGDLNIYLLLENLRQIVPQDMRFEKMTLDVAAHRLEIRGFCLESQSLSTFLQETRNLSYFKTVSLIDSVRENRSQLEVLSFNLEILLGDFH